jgi:hypothetical protein
MPQPDVIFGKKMLASTTVHGPLSGETRPLCPAADEVNKTKNDEPKNEEVDTLVAFLRGQAERGLA